MKKRALAILMAALTASTMFAVPTFAADYSGEDPQLEKNIKILTIWAEDNDNGMLLNKICEDYQKNVNPNFTWEYEMVASDNLSRKLLHLQHPMIFRICSLTKQVLRSAFSSIPERLKILQKLLTRSEQQII